MEPFLSQECVEVLAVNLSTFVNFPSFVVCYVRVYMLFCSLVRTSFFFTFSVYFIN
jgi:hypothetical protein